MNNSSFRDFGLSEKILATLDRLGYKMPSNVQQKVIPLALKDCDIIVKSRTGSGKTAAFAIPLCEKIKLEEKSPQVLVLTPTRELAVQVKEDIFNIGRFKRIRAVAVFGKQPISLQKRELSQRVHFIVGTPGRTLDHIKKGNIGLEKIKYLIVDEADEMLNMGFIDQIESIITTLPKDRVTMLFSATMPKEIERLCIKYMNKPISVEIIDETAVAGKINQVYYEIEDSKKFNLLNRIIYKELPDSCIIFCNTKDRVDMLWKKIMDKGYSSARLHGGMEQQDRLDTIKKFKRGEFNFLVSTDVAGRGIHVEDITHVINYDIPIEKESYVHRIGRTGRASKSGIAITFVCPWENKVLKTIEEYIGCSIPKGETPTEEEIKRGKAVYESQANLPPKIKKDNAISLNKEITKLYISAGKKKKIRPGDIVGAIISIKGITAEDIGIIDVQDNFSYVDILNEKGKLVLEGLQNSLVKGKKVRVEKANK